MATPKRSRPLSPPPAGWAQAHNDIDVLAQRVTGIEGNVGALADQVSSLANSSQSDMRALSDKIDSQIASLAASFQSDMRAIGAKLDSKPTNWYAFAAAGAAILTLLGGYVVQALAPINSDIGRHEREIGHFAETAVNRTDYFRDRDANGEWQRSLRDRLRFDEDNAVSQRQHSELITRLDERDRIRSKDEEDAVNRLDHSIEATEKRLNDRVDSVIAGLNQLRDQTAKH